MPSLSLVPSINNGGGGGGGGKSGLQPSFVPGPTYSLEESKAKFAGTLPLGDLVTVRAGAPSIHHGILYFALHSVSATAIFPGGLEAPWW